MLRKNRHLFILLLLILVIMSSMVIVALDSMRSVAGIDEMRHKDATAERQTQIDEETTICSDSRESEMHDESYKMSSVAIFILFGITIAALLGALYIKHNLNNPD